MAICLDGLGGCPSPFLFLFVYLKWVDKHTARDKFAPTDSFYIRKKNQNGRGSFKYDGNGIRRKAVEGDTITRYYYDGLNVLFEKDVAGLTQKSYTRGLGFPGGIGGLISMKRYEMEDNRLEEKTSYYHYDALGSVRGLSDQNGKLTAEFDYDVLGNGKNNKKWNTYRFSSKEFEDHAGLYYFGARYYDPEIGRWLTPDPLGFIDGPNRYLYVANNPLNFIDPWGLTREEILQAYNWLRSQYPELTKGINPNFYETRLPFDFVGMYLPNTILVDTEKIKLTLGGKDWTTAIVAHELIHAQEGFLKTIFITEKHHKDIAEKAEQIRRDYLKSKEHK